MVLATENLHLDVGDAWRAWPDERRLYDCYICMSVPCGDFVKPVAKETWGGEEERLFTRRWTADVLAWAGRAILPAMGGICAPRIGREEAGYTAMRLEERCIVLLVCGWDNIGVVERLNIT